ncbi:alpha/beta hydrolase family protein [Hymenobacter sp. GOD-10R]|uniref:alpha/beta hydrolase family protein n=1 Tax=Hymenobacter sp. GOD-10R TaxID=3093922 RepID=UPI002D77AFC9|nr:alpha/beta fold hydrolase [Hymenobacter sp. GOD-10R]WRQ27789.1 alpha/beta fold hydrolase [Hymenobacter sp. GOD-10R]
MDLVITLVPLSNGTYYAALDVPQQRINRMPVEVETKGDGITLKIEQAGSSFVGKIENGGARFTGTWQQPGLKAPLVLQRGTASAATARRARLTPPYREEDVFFANTQDKLRLGGTLTVPAGVGPFPAVVLVSDTGPQDRDVTVQEYRMFGILADYLTRRGIAVLRFDDRGVGKSSGNYPNATTADLVTDAQAGLAFLRSRSLIDPQHIGFVGHGEGANIALLAAAQQPQAAAFVVSLAGYGLPGRDVLLQQQGEIMRLIGANPEQVKAALALNEHMVDIIRQTPNDAQARNKVASLIQQNNSNIDPGMARARAAHFTSPWSRYYLDFDPKNKLPDVQCPVLALNGTADLEVAASTNLSILQKGLKGSHDITAQKLSGVNHLFQPEEKDWPLVNGQQQPNFSPKALEIIRAWIVERTVQPQPVPVTVKREAPAKPASKKVSKTAFQKTAS